MAILKDLPFPISVNESLTSVRGRLIKTTVARNYLKEMHVWAMQNKRQVDLAREFVKHCFDNKIVLRVDSFLAWPKKEVLVSQENYKAFHFAQSRDATNRIKQLHDAISEILDIDDRYFFYGDCCKLISDYNKKECLVVIKPEKVLNMSDILSYLNHIQMKENVNINTQGYKIYEQ